MTQPQSAGEQQMSDVTDAQELEELFTRSHNQPVILFKHSTTCPISAAAYQQMQRVRGLVSLVVVQRSRDLSRQIEERTGVRHESPQAIILRNGRAVWSASHWDVRADAIESAVNKHR